MKKIMMYVLLALLVIIVVMVMIGLSNPLRKPQEQIRASMLELTPIGTSMEDVLKVIGSNEKWEMMYANDKNGYSILGGRPSEPSPNETDTIVGKKSIRATIGKYNFDPQFDKDEILGSILYTFIDRYVSVYWAFDEDSKLIEVSVRKDAAGF